MQIMDHVGSSYFREDLRRLTVCKQWFSFARTACFKELQLSQKTLHRWLSSWDILRSSLLVEDSLEILDLELKGFEDWDSVSEPESHSQDVDAFETSTWDGDLGRKVRAAWTTLLNTELATLASIVQVSRRLRIMRIQASSERHPLIPHLPRRDYLSASSIRTFLSVRNLTVLDLDLCGTLLVPGRGHDDENDFHVCMSIGALLTTLRRLRLRMRSICADVLKPQHHDTSLRLSEVLINLSLSNESPMTTSAAHAARCGSTGGEFLKLKAEIEDQAEALVARMTAPKKIRILTHSLPHFEMRSLDVLTGKCTILADGMAWEDEGKTVEDDSDSESEIMDDGSSTSSDE